MHDLQVIWHKLLHRDITLYVYYNINSVHLYIAFLSNLYQKPLFGAFSRIPKTFCKSM